jgi:hypothetical protein
MTLDFLTTLLTLRTTTLETKVLQIIIHGLYVFVLTGSCISNINLLFYGSEIEERINQTLRLSSDFENLFHGGKETRE